MVASYIVNSNPYSYTQCRATYILENQRLQASTLIDLYRISFRTVYQCSKVHG